MCFINILYVNFVNVKQTNLNQIHYINDAKNTYFAL